jgi:hypothetical protein
MDSTPSFDAPDVDHPRPQLRRSSWVRLDGLWDFADDVDGRWRDPRQVAWDEQIVVPFSPETAASGIDRPGYRLACWYRRRVTLPSAADGGRLVLHFEAVDHRCEVWLDGHPAYVHEGGYTRFTVDVSRYADGAEHELVVHAEDDPADLAKPRGKQDWELEPHSIWYPRTTGIWQSVWLEELPSVGIERLHWTGDLDRYAVGMSATLHGRVPDGVRLHVRLSYGDRLLVDDTVVVAGPRVERSFSLDGRGLDTLRDELTWRPDHPALVDAVLEVQAADGTVLDRVESYTGLRTVGVRGGRILLNGRPITLRLVLDQGYWPDTGLTAPDEAALRRDLELVKAMGFNGVRKHQKVEDPRWLYWADRLGVLVWSELPPSYRFDEIAVDRTVREWTAVIERDRSHPCIVAWVPFNESTGVLGLPSRVDQRHYVEAVALLTKALDPSRLVVANDGWEVLGGDVIGVHDYDPDPERIRQRYRPEVLAQALRDFGDAGRQQVLDDPSAPATGSDGPRAVVLSECGGIGYVEAGPTVARWGTTGADDPADRLHQPAAWGYSTVSTPDELLADYAALVGVVGSLPGVSGFCYTQLTDTYQEVNGLLRADRTPKVPVEEVRRANHAPARRRGTGTSAPGA